MKIIIGSLFIILLLIGCTNSSIRIISNSHGFVSKHQETVEELLRKQLTGKIDKQVLTDILSVMHNEWEMLKIKEAQVKPEEEGFWCGLNGLSATVQNVYQPDDRRKLIELSLEALVMKKPMPAAYNCYAWPYRETNMTILE